MGDITVIFLGYLFMNLFGLIIMKIDKNRAVRHEYRISEKNLWTIALLGGAAGATIGMQLFRHKTKHVTFKFGFPALAIIEMILFIYLCVATASAH